jgi:hypothetical protein
VREQRQRFGQHRLGGEKPAPVVSQESAALEMQGIRLAVKTGQ